MNEKIVEMVKLAIENGAVSQKHRDLILNNVNLTYFCIINYQV